MGRKRRLLPRGAQDIKREITPISMYGFAICHTIFFIKILLRPAITTSRLTCSSHIRDVCIGNQRMLSLFILGASTLWLVSMQIPFLFQLSASGRSQGFIGFLPFVPLRLRYLKPKELLPAPTTLGEHIRQRRVRLQLTLKKAGKLLGMNEWSLINLEKGRTAPKTHRLPAIIQFLGDSPFPEPRTIPEGLLAKRRERGWSRRVAARHLGIDESPLRD
jgi:DNA-binding XRE family transcriptional regulator